jgi:hypothetical protein
VRRLARKRRPRGRFDVKLEAEVVFTVPDHQFTDWRNAQQTPIDQVVSMMSVLMDRPSPTLPDTLYLPPDVYARLVKKQKRKRQRWARSDRRRRKKIRGW